MKTSWILAASLFFPSLTFSAPPALPPPAQRAAMVLALSAEMQRLDGEGLIVRERNRRVSFAAMAKRLSEEARAAGSWSELLRAFNRLDAAYPNLHARLDFAPGLATTRVRPAIRFNPRFAPGSAVEYFVTNGEHAGARLVEINGRPMAAWQEEALELCKFPLRLQCELELFSGLSREWLSWHRGEPLRYTLEREGRRYEQKVAVEEFPTPARAADPGCGEDRDLYAGYTIAHEGRFGCVFLKNGDPSRALLRISSFYYEEDEKGAIRSVADEVEALWPWWRRHAPSIRELLVDIAGNHGGNAPIEWYTILFPAPFQEQWVTFRKIPELLENGLRQQILFWGTPQQEVWFQALRRDGTWDRTALGEFLPPVPMFCAGDDRSSCREGLFPVRNHGFRGRVTLLLNQWCVSSCDGFAYALKEQLGGRVLVAGLPQAADTAYSRLTLRLTLESGLPEGFRVAVVSPESQPSAGSLVLTQGVAVTRSVKPDGSVVSGIPLPIDRAMDLPFELNERGWRAYAVQKLQ